MRYGSRRDPRRDPGRERARSAVAASVAGAGLVEASGDEVVDGRLRRYYRMTDEGSAAGAWFGAFSGDTLVAEATNPAGRVYRSLGFEPDNAQAYRKPPR